MQENSSTAHKQNNVTYYVVYVVNEAEDDNGSSNRPQIKKWEKNKTIMGLLTRKKKEVEGSSCDGEFDQKISSLPKIRESAMS